MSFTNAHVCTPVSTTPAPITCAKCGTDNAGKLSCCARGGSWFKHCGDPDDSNFDHTWYEGIRVCKESASREAQAMLSRQITTAREQKPTQQKTIGSVTDSMNDVYTTGAVTSKGCDKRLTFAFITSILLTTLLVYM